MIWCLERFVEGLAIDYEDALERALGIRFDFNGAYPGVKQLQMDFIIMHFLVSKSLHCRLMPARLIVRT